VIEVISLVALIVLCRVLQRPLQQRCMALSPTLWGTTKGLGASSNVMVAT
jgi:hypothetical protein